MSVSCCCFQYVYTQWFCFVLVLYNNLLSESFVELCFEAGKWIAWLYFSWDSIPQGCAWKWEASLNKSILGLGRVMNRDVARVLEQIKNCLRYGGARFLHALNTNTALLKISFSLTGSSPKYCSFVSRLLKKNQISSILQLFCEEN